MAKYSKRIIPLACRICKKVFTVPMGYNWQACDKCTKEALDTAEAKKAWDDYILCVYDALMDEMESEELDIDWHYVHLVEGGSYQ